MDDALRVMSSGVSIHAISKAGVTFLPRVEYYSISLDWPSWHSVV